MASILLTSWLILFISFVLVFFAWTGFLAMMNLKGNQTKVTAPIKILAFLVVWLGRGFSITLNWTLGHLFLEIPREKYFSHRLARHIDDFGWRGEVARWISFHLLDPYDPDGRHVVPEEEDIKKDEYV